MSELPLEAVRDASKVGTTLVLVGFCWLVLSVFLVLVYASPNPLSLNQSARTQFYIRQILPEGWGFFTASQRLPQYGIWKRKDGKYVDAFDGPESEPANLFGFGKKPRAEGLEMGLLTSMVADRFRKCDRRDWRKCAGDDLAPSITIENPTPHPFYCGQYTIVELTPVPFSWAHFARVTMPSRYLPINSVCAK